jgi:serine acetyltransferase/GT2 family glycosyltransferase
MAKANTKRSVKLGIIVVGRGGTECLRRCLNSIDVAEAAVVYVDRSANQGSCEAALGQGVEVVRLDTPDAAPSARARNAGFRRLLEIAPSVEFVQFVDGDCELSAGWLSKGIETLGKDERLAAVCGLIRERNPDRSVYSRLRDLEREVKIGEIAVCSNAFLTRRRALEEVGTFDGELTAGKEAELCSRLRTHGWKIRRVDTLMCLQDAGTKTFAQWWQQEIAHGYGALDLATRFGSGPDVGCVESVRSARVWGIGVPAAIASAGMVGASAGGPMLGLALAGTGLLALPAESLRIAARAGREGQPLALALAYGGLSVLARFAHVAGQYRYVAARAKAREGATSERGDASRALLTAANDQDWQADKRRYAAGAWLNERAIWAVAAYRFGKRIEAGADCLTKTLLRGVHACCHWLADALLGIDLPLTAEIGPGLRIHGRGGIVVRPGAKIGANVTLAQGCAVGSGGAKPPVLENDVELGAYAQVIDGVRVGRGARVTAMGVVMSSVAARVTVAGNPAKLVVKPKHGAAASTPSTNRSRSTKAKPTKSASAKAKAKPTKSASAKAKAKPTRAASARGTSKVKPTQTKRRPTKSTKTSVKSGVSR